MNQLDFDRTREFYNKDDDFMLDHIGDPYEHGIPGYLELLACGLRLNKYVQKIFPNYKPRFTDVPHCTELQGLRVKLHNLLKQPEDFDVARMPPWIWWVYLDRWVNCPTSGWKRIK